MPHPSTLPPPPPGSDPPSASPTESVDAAELNPGRTARRRRIWPWLIVVPLVVAALSVLTFNWRAAARLQAALDDLAARGEPITYAEAYALLAANPPADDDNLAGVPLLLSMHDSEPGRAMRQQLEDDQPELLQLWDNFEPPWFPLSGTGASAVGQTEEDWSRWTPENLVQWSSSAPEWIEHPDGAAATVYQMTVDLHPLIHDLAADCRDRSSVLWPKRPLEGIALLHESPGSLFTTARSTSNRRTLRMVAIAAVERGDADLAAAAIEVATAFMRTYAGHGAAMDTLEVGSYVAVTSDLLFAGLLRRIWDEEQLARLQLAIEMTLPACDWGPYQRNERVFGLAASEHMKRHRSLGLDLNEEGGGGLMLRALPNGFFDHHAASSLELLDDPHLQPGAMLPAEPPRHDNMLPSWLGWLAAWDQTHLVGIAFHNVVVSLRAAETRLRLAHAAIALKRFYLQHDRYPDQWQELIPGILDQPPLDPFTRGVLVLLPADPAARRERPVIYSLGLNREDNGGTQAFDPDTPTVLGDRFATGYVVWGYPGDEPPAGPGDD